MWVGAYKGYNQQWPLVVAGSPSLSPAVVPLQVWCWSALLTLLRKGAHALESVHKSLHRVVWLSCPSLGSQETPWSGWDQANSCGLFACIFSQSKSYLVGSVLPTGSMLHGPSPRELPHPQLQGLWWKELQFWVFNQPISRFWGAQQSNDMLIWNFSFQSWSLVLNYFFLLRGLKMTDDPSFPQSYLELRGRSK